MQIGVEIYFIELGSPALQMNSLPAELTGNAIFLIVLTTGFKLQFNINKKCYLNLNWEQHLLFF